MKASFQAIAVMAGAVAGVLSSNLAMSSTISKNIPGMIRHPFHEAAKAVGADDGRTSHRQYYTNTTHHYYSTTHRNYGRTHRRHRRH